MIYEGQGTIWVGLFYLQPVCTFLWSYILISEKLTITLLVGSILILFGAGLVNYNKDTA